MAIDDLERGERRVPCGIVGEIGDRRVDGSALYWLDENEGRATPAGGPEGTAPFRTKWPAKA